MFVGHGLLAFALVAGVAARRWDRERALWAGLVAGAFATLPDVDMLYALSGLAGGPTGPAAASDAFWAAAHEFHRAVTHSLVVGSVAAVAFAAWRTRSRTAGRRRLLAAAAGLGLLSGLVAVVWSVSGPVAAAMVVPFALGGLAITAAAGWVGFSPADVLGLAAVGLGSHPFGDLLTGSPPALLYPLDLRLFGERVTLHPDATLHLLGAFFLELAAIWLAVVVYGRLRDQSLRGAVRPRAALGVVYAGAVLAVPSPSVDVASPFVFSVLSIGLVGVPVGREREMTRARLCWQVVVTALAAVTVAALAYTAAYIVL